MSTTKTVKPARKRRTKTKAKPQEIPAGYTFLIGFLVLLFAVVYYGGGALLLYGFLNWLGLWPLF